MTNAARAFDALGDPTRRQVFERLARRPLAVVELAETLPISRPAVSQHLKVRKEAGLVVALKDGARRLYQINPRGVQAMREYLDRFWDKALAAFKDYIETEEKKP